MHYRFAWALDSSNLLEIIMANDAKQHFLDILTDFDTAMLVSHASDRSLHARPMAIADLDSGGDLWFVTSSSSGKVDEILDDAEVAVTMQSSSRFLSLSGKASLHRDRELIAKLWKEPWKVWFPKGEDDPDIVLLKVTADDGEYWDNSGFSGLKYLFAAGKAYLKGERPEVDLQVNQRVSL